VQIPTPDGRSQAGWQTLQALKVQPEVFTMLEQLREHKLFAGQWKTASQVAWSMIYLGLKACHQFYSGEEENWDGYRSNFIVYQQGLWAQEEMKKQEALIKGARSFRNVFHAYLNKGTAFGKYKAWKTLDSMINSRNVAEDTRSFDEAVCSPGAPALGSNLVFDNRIADYWTKIFPVAGGSLELTPMETIYVELTTDHYADLEIANATPEAD
jgi:hypothetical protein